MISWTERPGHRLWLHTETFACSTVSVVLRPPGRAGEGDMTHLDKGWTHQTSPRSRKGVRRD